MNGTEKTILDKYSSVNSLKNQFPWKEYSVPRQVDVALQIPLDQFRDSTS